MYVRNMHEFGTFLCMLHIYIPSQNTVHVICTFHEISVDLHDQHNMHVTMLMYMHVSFNMHGFGMLSMHVA